MLCGMHKPTLGDAWVCGHSIKNDMLDVRRYLGYCPQHDILWDDLTIHEHVSIFYRLKGVPRNIPFHVAIVCLVTRIPLLANHEWQPRLVLFFLHHLTACWMRHTIR